jgi:hypothetical protein
VQTDSLFIILGWLPDGFKKHWNIGGRERMQEETESLNALRLAGDRKAWNNSCFEFSARRGTRETKGSEGYCM